MTPDSRAALEISIASSFLRFHQADRRFAQIARGDPIGRSASVVKEDNAVRRVVVRYLKLASDGLTHLSASVSSIGDARSAMTKQPDPGAMAAAWAGLQPASAAAILVFCDPGRSEHRPRVLPSRLGCAVVSFAPPLPRRCSRPGLADPS